MLVLVIACKLIKTIKTVKSRSLGLTVSLRHPKQTVYIFG